MEKEFIPYEQALALKELGFDEYCFGLYGKSEGTLFKVISEKFDDVDDLHFIKAPLWQQAFRWFKEKYDLHSHIRESLSFDKILEFVSQINGSYVTHNHFDKPINRFETYEEAKMECLKKLIEIVKKL
jgi:hypothetical protein